MSERSAEHAQVQPAALVTLQQAEGGARVQQDLVLADVFRRAAINVWAYGPPCEDECTDDCAEPLHCEYARPIIALAEEFHRG